MSRPESRTFVQTERPTAVSLYVGDSWAIDCEDLLKTHEMEWRMGLVQERIQEPSTRIPTKAVRDHAMHPIYTTLLFLVR